MPGLNHRTFFGTGFGGTSGALFKAVSASDICFAARCSSMHCICFHHVDMEALSLTHTGPDKPTIEELCGGMNLITISLDCLGTYVTFSYLKHRNEETLGWAG